jgi:hypothetical protein
MNPFLGLERAIPISSCVGKFKIKEWLPKNHSEYGAATPGMRQGLWRHFLGEKAVQFNPS